MPTLYQNKPEGVSRVGVGRALGGLASLGGLGLEGFLGGLGFGGYVVGVLEWPEALTLNPEPGNALPAMIVRSRSSRYRTSISGSPSLAIHRIYIGLEILLLSFPYGPYM